MFPVKSQNDAAAILKTELHITGSEVPDYSVNTTTSATVAALDTTATGMNYMIIYVYICIIWMYIFLTILYIYSYYYLGINNTTTTSTTTAAAPDTSKHPPDIYSSPTQRGKQLQFHTPPRTNSTTGVKIDSFSGSILNTIGSRKSPEQIANEANSAVQAAIASAAVDPSKQLFEPSAASLKNQVRQLSKHFGLAMRQTSAVMYRSLKGSGLKSSGYGYDFFFSFYYYLVYIVIYML